MSGWSSCNKSIFPFNELCMIINKLNEVNNQKIAENSKTTTKNPSKNNVDLNYRILQEAIKLISTSQERKAVGTKKCLRDFKSLIQTSKAKQIWQRNGGFLFFKKEIMQSKRNLKRTLQNKRYRQIQILLLLPRLWERVIKGQKNTLRYKRWDQVFGQLGHQWEIPYFKLLLEAFQHQSIQQAVKQLQNQMKSSLEHKILLQKHTIIQWIQLYITKQQSIQVSLNSQQDICKLVQLDLFLPIVFRDLKTVVPRTIDCFSEEKVETKPQKVQNMSKKTKSRGNLNRKVRSNEKKKIYKKKSKKKVQKRSLKKKFGQKHQWLKVRDQYQTF